MNLILLFLTFTRRNSKKVKTIKEIRAAKLLDLYNPKQLISKKHTS